MEFYAKNTGSNEFFARRALYNAGVKIRRGCFAEAKKYLDLAMLCIRAGGVNGETKNRALALRLELEAAA